MHLKKLVNYRISKYKRFGYVVIKNLLNNSDINIILKNISENLYFSENLYSRSSKKKYDQLHKDLFLFRKKNHQSLPFYLIQFKLWFTITEPCPVLKL